MIWNYRLIKDRQGQLALYEVYFKGDKIEGWMEEPILQGSKKEMLMELEFMKKALDQPILNDELIS